MEDSLDNGFELKLQAQEVKMSVMNMRHSKCQLQVQTLFIARLTFHTFFPLFIELRWIKYNHLGCFHLLGLKSQLKAITQGVAHAFLSLNHLVPLRSSP